MREEKVFQLTFHVHPRRSACLSSQRQDSHSGNTQPGFCDFVRYHLNHLVGMVVIRKMIEAGLCQLLGSHLQISRPIVEAGKACILVLKLRGGNIFRSLRTFLKSHLGIHRLELAIFNEQLSFLLQEESAMRIMPAGNFDMLVFGRTLTWRAQPRQEHVLYSTRKLLHHNKSRAPRNKSVQKSLFLPIFTAIAKVKNPWSIC